MAKELLPGGTLTHQKGGGFQPTLSHRFMKLLEQKGVLLRVFTQNIDALERAAGLSDDKIVEAHGSFYSATCIGPRLPITRPNVKKKESAEDEDLEPRANEDSLDENESTDSEAGSWTSEESAPGIKNAASLGCGKKFTQEWMRDQLQMTSKDELTLTPSSSGTRRKRTRLPLCPHCSGLVKPDITFFGENLPHKFHEYSQKDFQEAELLIVMGTSLKVHPFASLIHAVHPKVPRLLMNLERVGETQSSQFGFDFSWTHQTQGRDALFLGTTDEGCLKLSEALGWNLD